MIPTIGFMIGAYIITRCLEMIGRSKDNSIASAVRIVATLTIIVAIIGMALLALSSDQATSIFQGIK